MKQEFIERMAPPPMKKRGPSFRQLEFERRYRRSTLEGHIRYLEEKFRNCNKIKHPAKWLQLQDELGKAYKQLMKLTINR